MSAPININLTGASLKLTLLFLLLAWGAVSSAANRYLVAGGNGNWNSTTNWSATSGGSSGASFPAATDAVIIDTNSANANIHVNVASACSSISFYANYTGTFSLDSTITTSSTVTLGANMTFVGNSNWIMQNTCSIYSRGKSFPNLALGGWAMTYGFSDTLRVSGTLTLNGGGGGVAFNSTTGVVICGLLKSASVNIIYLSSNVIAGSTTINSNSTINTSNGSSLFTSGLTLNANLAGSSAIRLTGGTWSGSGSFSSNLYFQGNCGISGAVNCGNAGFYYVSGTVTTAGSAVQTSNFVGFTCPAVIWDTLKIGGYNQTYGLGGELNIGGRLIFNGDGIATFSGAYSITCKNVDFRGTNVSLSSNLNVTEQTLVSGASYLYGAYVLYTGSYTGNATLGGSFTKLVFNGKGTWSGTATMAHSRVVEINTTDTLRISGTINFLTGSVRHIAGTVIATGSTLYANNFMALNTAGMYWDNITLYAYNTTNALQSDLNLTGTLRLTILGGSTISGAYNINTGNLYLEGGGINIPAGINVSGLTTVAGNTTLNGSFTLYTGGLASYATLGGTFSGIVFNSTGIWSGSAAVAKTITINTAGTLTMSGAISSTGTLTRTAGTVNAAGSTFSRSGTFDPQGITWGNITLTNTTTLTTDCNLTGSLNVTTGTLSGAYTYYVGGGFTYSGAGALGGVSNIVMNGKGTIAVTNPSGAVAVPFTINTTDTITLGTNFRINNCPFTFTAGKIVSIGSTFETSGTASTININNTGFRVGTYLSSISQGFGGSNGFTIGTFSCPTAGRTFTFKAGKTYTIETEISVAGTAASHMLWKSDTPGTRAIVTVNQGVAVDLGFCDATDLDSSLGITLLTYKGTRSNALNWNLLPTVPKSGAFTFN